MTHSPHTRLGGGVLRSGTWYGGDPAGSAKLKTALARMEENLGQAPEEMKPVLAIVKKKMEARIAELEAAKK